MPLIRVLEDPTILSGTLRSTLDVFNEYEDADIVSQLPPHCYSITHSFIACSMKPLDVFILFLLLILRLKIMEL